MKKIIPNITYKSVLSGIKNIDNRNKAFNELDKQSQRMEIAWDALKLITQNIIKANLCGYWDGKISEISLSEINAKKFQQELLKTNNLQNCEVCARGIMMLSLIRIGNTLDPRFDNVRSGSSDSIKGFTIDNFLEMENEYECGVFNHPYHTNTEEKLANICCNILINGNFNTKDKKNYITVKNTK